MSLDCFFPSTLTFKLPGGIFRIKLMFALCFSSRSPELLFLCIDMQLGLVVKQSPPKNKMYCQKGCRTIFLAQKQNPTLKASLILHKRIKLAKLNST